MKIIVVETPEFKIDGGAFFGVVPKIIWHKKYKADENNMCNAACRSILVDDGNRIILFDTGIGEEPAEKHDDMYFTNYSQNLEANLKNAGYSPQMITDVVLTHLHFDHCGGTTKIDKKSGERVLTFPNATHYISKSQWENALNPNYREKSSYIADNFILLKGSEKLVLVKENISITNSVQLRLFHGHTQGLMLPVFNDGAKTVFFAGDLIPARASIPLAWVSAYDLFPLTSIDEKREILNEAADKNWLLIFQHDAYCECCYVEKTERGVRAKEALRFREI